MNLSPKGYVLCQHTKLNSEVYIKLKKPLGDEKVTPPSAFKLRREYASLF